MSGALFGGHFTGDKWSRISQLYAQGKYHIGRKGEAPTSIVMFTAAMDRSSPAATYRHIDFSMVVLEHVSECNPTVAGNYITYAPQQPLVLSFHFHLTSTHSSSSTSPAKPLLSHTSLPIEWSSTFLKLPRWTTHQEAHRYLRLPSSTTINPIL